MLVERCILGFVLEALFGQQISMNTSVTREQIASCFVNIFKKSGFCLNVFLLLSSHKH